MTPGKPTVTIHYAVLGAEARIAHPDGLHHARLRSRSIVTSAAATIAGELVATITCASGASATTAARKRAWSDVVDV